MGIEQGTEDIWSDLYSGVIGKGREGCVNEGVWGDVGGVFGGVHHSCVS